MSNQGVCFDIDGMHRTRPHWEYPGGRVLAYNSSVAITGKVCYATADLYNKQSTRLREPSIVAGQAYLGRSTLLEQERRLRVSGSRAIGSHRTPGSRLLIVVGFCSGLDLTHTPLSLSVGLRRALYEPVNPSSSSLFRLRISDHRVCRPASSMLIFRVVPLGMPRITGCQSSAPLGLD